MARTLFPPPPHVLVDSADAAYVETLSRILDYGEAVTAGASLSVGSQKSTRELLNFTVVHSSPRDRLIYNAPPFKLLVAVARFVWMMAGSDRLADIAFYEPKVSRFTDDEISVPGSNYGQRILHPRPGLDQLRAAIDRLIKDPHTRRAAISIYHPEDVVRQSPDIPCAFGIFYHIRGDVLRATTVMRSNNAFVLLPYNIFEFSLLAEVVATEVNVPLGPLTHTALSMHIYEEHVEAAGKVVDGFFKQRAGLKRVSLPEMPSDPNPLSQIKDLVIIEASLRHESQGLTGSNIEEWITKGNKLNSYWRQFYYLLLLHVVTQKSHFLRANLRQQELALDALDSVIDPPWKSFLPEGIFVAKGEEVGGVDGLAALELPPGLGAAKIIQFHSTRGYQQLNEKVDEYEDESGDIVSRQEFGKLQIYYADRIEGVAARDEVAITKEEIVQVLQGIRQDGGQ
ncbi:MAG TPA: thymidylate synthase [Pyrinomonadaceae bacterium]|jgi:hypothetical protein